MNTSGHASSPFLRIPECVPELFEIILENLDSINDCANLSGVSKTLHAKVVPYLYRCITYDMDHHTFYSLVCLLQTMAENPELAKLVKILDLGLSPYVLSREMRKEIKRKWKRIKKRSKANYVLPFSEMRDHERDMRMIARSHQDLGYSQDDIDVLVGMLRQWFHVSNYRRYRSTAWTAGEKTCAWNLCYHLAQRFPNIAVHRTSIPSSNFTYNPTIDRAVEKGPSMPFQDLKTVHISKQRYNNDAESSSTILLCFLGLSELKSIYTLGLCEFVSLPQRSEWREVIANRGRFSGVKNIAFDCASFSVEHMTVILQTLKRLKRFRWTDKPAREHNHEMLSFDSEKLIRLLRPYANNLQELNLRFDGGTCQGIRPRPDCPSYSIGPLSEFRQLKALTIDPTAIWGRPLGTTSPPGFQNMIPHGLCHLGLIYESGHWLKCDCLRKTKQEIQKQVWEEEVMLLGDNTRAWLPHLTSVDIISANKDFIREGKKESRDKRLERARRVFLRGGVESCTISHVSKNTVLPPFKTLKAVPKSFMLPPIVES